MVKPLPPIPKNPAASVARLAGVALVAFALGEPVLLRAAPQTGVRALAAVIVFLFSTGLVMAAGASMDALRPVKGPAGVVGPPPGMKPPSVRQITVPTTISGGVLNVGGHSVASSTPSRPDVPAPM